MGNVNILEMLMLLKNGNPREVAMKIIQNNFPNNPELVNLMNLAERGDYNSIENYAKSMLGAQGKDLGRELSNLRSSINNL